MTPTAIGAAAGAVVAEMEMVVTSMNAPSASIPSCPKRLRRSDMVAGVGVATK